jgi:hypothetical protein
LTLHFALIAIYADPFIKEKKKIHYYSQWYAYPFFHQNWNLFVPPPDSNYRLYAEFENNGKQKVDLFSEILTQHQTNRLKGYGSLLATFYNSIHIFEKNTTLQKQLNGPVNNDFNFAIIKNSAIKYLNATRRIKISTVNLTLVVDRVGSDIRKVYFD